MADIEKLLTRIDMLRLAELAGASFTHPAARDARSACPLHKGDNPTAFSVYRDGTEYQLWHCHTRCNTGGDAISFVRAWQGLDFPEAVAYLCEQFQVPLEDIGWNDPKSRTEAEKRHKRTDVLTAAQECFTARLWSPEGEQALAYTLSRGFTTETIERAGWGWTPGDKRLGEYLSLVGADLGLARELGLVRSDGHDFTANANGQEAAPHGWLVYPHRMAERVGYFSSRAIEIDGSPRPNPSDKSRNLPGPRQLYRADVSGNEKVVLVEGPADAETLRQLEQSAWALCGLGSLPDDDLRRLRQKTITYLSPDSDTAGEMALNKGKLARTASLLGPLTMILPPMQSGKDFNGWLQDGCTAEQVAAMLGRARTWIECRMDQAACCAPSDLDEKMGEIGELLAALPEGSRPRYYKIAQNVLGLTRKEIQDMIRLAAQNGKGQVLSSIKDHQLCFLGRPLLNGVIQITHELSMDDGQNMPHVRYTVNGKLVDGHSLDELDINADEFADFKWVPRHWGRGPILYISHGQYYELARAIQEVSMEAKRERVYTYTGWTTVNGERCYLSSSGAISAEKHNPDTRVELGMNNLRYYSLPEPPTGEDRFLSFQASLDFLCLGPRSITAPLWAAMYAAPLTEIAPLYAMVWVYGQTQSGKSTIVHLALCHFGGGFISSRQYHSPMDWTSTSTALEGAMFTTKDAPIVIDDFAPQFASPADSRELHRKAHYVIRSVGNRSSRGRARADLTERMIRVPRGLVIATAENPLMGQSVVGRTIYVNVGRGDILPTDGSQRDDLNIAQDAAQRGFYAQAMSLFVQWLAANWERVKDEIPGRIDAASKAARENNPNLQNRLPDYYALLHVAQETALTAFTELGLVTPFQAAKEVEANRLAILEVISQQAERIATESPVRKIFEALSSLLARRKIYLAPRTTTVDGFEPPYQAELVGWFDPRDKELVFLESNTCLSHAKQFWNNLSENLDILPDAFQMQTKQIAGLIQPGKDRTEQAVWVAGKTRRVLVVNRSKVLSLYGVDLSNEPSTPGFDPES